MRPRLVHVIPDLRWGSAETQVLLVGRWLSEATEMHICTRHVPAATRAVLELRGVTMHLIPRSRFHGSLESFRLAACFRRLRPDIVHLWRIDTTWPAAPLALLAGTRRLIVDQRWPRFLPSDLSECGARLVSGFLAHTNQGKRPTLAGPSAFPRTSIQGKEFTDYCRWESNHGPALDSTASDVRIPNMRRELGLFHEDRFVIVAGALRQHKRIEDVIWAVDLLNIVGNRIHLLIAGDGPDRGRLERWAKLTRTEPFIHFLGVRDDLAKIWSQCELAIFAAEADDPPVAFMEALAHGVPVLASRIAPHRALRELRRESGDGRDLNECGEGRRSLEAGEGIGSAEQGKEKILSAERQDYIAERQDSRITTFSVGDRAAIARGVEHVLRTMPPRAPQTDRAETNGSRHSRSLAGWDDPPLPGDLPPLPRTPESNFYRQYSELYDL